MECPCSVLSRVVSNRFPGFRRALAQHNMSNGVAYRAIPFQINPGVLTIWVKGEPVSAPVDVGLECGLEASDCFNGSGRGPLILPVSQNTLREMPYYTNSRSLTKCVTVDPLWITPMEYLSQPVVRWRNKLYTTDLMGSHRQC